MFIGEEVLIGETGEVGTIKKNHGDGTFDVQIAEEVVRVSEFDLIPNDLDFDEDIWDLEDEDDDTFEDLEPYRINANYY